MSNTKLNSPSDFGLKFFTQSKSIYNILPPPTLTAHTLGLFEMAIKAAHPHFIPSFHKSCSYFCPHLNLIRMFLHEALCQNCHFHY